MNKNPEEEVKPIEATSTGKPKQRKWVRVRESQAQIEMKPQTETYPSIETQRKSLALGGSIQCLTKLRESNLAIQTRCLGRKEKIAKRSSTLPAIILEESDIELDIKSGPKEERVENMEVASSAIKKRTWTKLSRVQSEKEKCERVENKEK